MANFALAAKRTALSGAYSFWINSATGEMPYTEILGDGVNITFKPGQVERMQASINNSMDAKYNPDDLNVKLPWGDIFIPLLAKRYWYYGAGAIVGLFGIGYLMGQNR